MSAGAIVGMVLAIVLIVFAILGMGGVLVILIIDALDPYNDEYRETRREKHGRNS